MNKILIICGPTATGKTDLAIKLAKKYNGEIISADSRQVYKGMDIGTGKDIDPISNIQFPISNVKNKNNKLQVGFRKKEGIPVWLVDICKPDYVFNVGQYQELVKVVISDIEKRGKLPIVVGGTGLYIKSILEPLDKMQIPPNFKLRQQLNNQTTEQLKNLLIQLNKNKWESMNHSDKNNPRRLVRAIEVAEYEINDSRNQTHKIPGIRTGQSPLPIGDFLVIGLTASLSQLKLNIEKRVEKRIKQGMLTEIGNLLNSGYTWNLTSMSGLGYKEWKDYFEVLKNKNKIPGIKRTRFRESTEIQKIINLWKLHEMQYAKKQMTWFKKMPDIHWFDISESSYPKPILSLVNEWYNNY